MARRCQYAKELDKIPIWLNPYQVEAWVRFRNTDILIKTRDWHALTGKIAYGNNTQIGTVTELEQALQGGQLVAHGRKRDGQFSPIPAIEWIELAFAPLDLSRQHPYVDIQFRTDEVIALFPMRGSQNTKTNQSSLLDSQKGRRGRTPGTGYQMADALIYEKMSEAIKTDPALNATSAARLFAEEAPGASFEAKLDRLSRGYRRREK